VKLSSAGVLLPHSPYIFRRVTDSSAIRLERKQIHSKPDRTVVTLVTHIRIKRLVPSLNFP
jgi:hypothetical protein